jgi:hypothetical protein
MFGYIDVYICICIYIYTHRIMYILRRRYAPRALNLGFDFANDLREKCRESFSVDFHVWRVRHPQRRLQRRRRLETRWPPARGHNNIWFLVRLFSWCCQRRRGSIRQERTDRAQLFVIQLDGSQNGVHRKFVESGSLRARTLRIMYYIYIYIYTYIYIYIYINVRA